MLAGPRLFFDKEETRDFPTLLAKFGMGALASPYRSTVPLLALVKDDAPLFKRIANACGCAGELSVHFEYQVAVPGVEGNPSQTDAMVVSPACTLALEAKWTEPRYETVATRLKNRIAKLLRDDPVNADKHAATQQTVIAGWLGLLGRHASAPLAIEQAGDLVYQMIHRAASACHMPGPSALAYLHFEPSPAKGAARHAQYRADLADLHHVLGNPRAFPFFLVSIPLRLTHPFGAIQNLPKGAKPTDLQVRKALATAKLFEFGEPNIDRVG